MKLRLVQKGVLLDPGLRRFISDRVSAILRRLEPQVRWVRILLEDTNGPRGGLDKRCVVSTGGDTLETRVVEVRAVELRAAISSALRRSARSVIRALERERDGFAGPALRSSLARTSARRWASLPG